MKLKAKLAEDAAEKETSDWDEAFHDYQRGFIAGFEKARELIIKALKHSDSYEWEEDIIVNVGEEEVE